MLKSSGVDHRVVLYLEEQPTADVLRSIIDGLEDPPGDLVRRDAFFENTVLAEEGFDEASLESRDGVVEVLVRHPRLLQRPILVRGARAIIGRPRERVPAFVRD